MSGLTFVPASTRADETVHSPPDKMGGVFLLSAIYFYRGNRQQATDHSEGKFEVQIDCECSDVAKSIPYCPADGEIDRLQVNGKPQAIKRVHFRYIGLHDAQSPGNAPFPNVYVSDRSMSGGCQSACQDSSQHR